MHTNRHRIPRLRLLPPLLAAMFGCLGTASLRAFDIYEYLPYARHIEAGEIVRGRASGKWFESLGIRPVNLVYENRLLDYPNGDKRHAVVSPDKIRLVALAADRKGLVPVSLDMESWNRFDPATPALYLQALRIFRAANPDAFAGLYATVPQDTYAWNNGKRAQADRLNAMYAPVAAAVDYFSPSLYNYSGGDFAAWEEGARYNIAAAHAYAPGKKVLPYISPGIQVNGVYRMLTYDEMMQRLQTLRSLGADGCIVWGSSGSKVNGEPPLLDPRDGWLKALVDFRRSHP